MATRKTVLTIGVCGEAIRDLQKLTPGPIQLVLQDPYDDYRDEDIPETIDFNVSSIKVTPQRQPMVKSVDIDLSDR